MHKQRDAEGRGALKTPDIKYSKRSRGHVEGQAKAQAGEAGRAQLTRPCKFCRGIWTRP